MQNFWPETYKKTFDNCTGIWGATAGFLSNSRQTGPLGNEAPCSRQKHASVLSLSETAILIIANATHSVSAGTAELSSSTLSELQALWDSDSVSLLRFQMPSYLHCCLENHCCRSISLRAQSDTEGRLRKPLKGIAVAHRP
ncbi:UNVERIFIED_CONTAM: hypothetical protein FKN15_074327 [Acipenser sinensis]